MPRRVQLPFKSKIITSSFGGTVEIKLENSFALPLRENLILIVVTTVIFFQNSNNVQKSICKSAVLAPFKNANDYRRCKRDFKKIVTKKSIHVAMFTFFGDVGNENLNTIDSLKLYVCFDVRNHV